MKLKRRNHFVTSAFLSIALLFSEGCDRKEPAGASAEGAEKAAAAQPLAKAPSFAPTSPPAAAPAVSSEFCRAPHQQKADSAACVACEKANCPDGIGAGCDHYSGKDRETCMAALTCLRTSGCMHRPPGGILTCFCGENVDALGCQAPEFAPKGACAAEIKAGFPPNATNRDIALTLTQRTNPSNAATALAFCDYVRCGDPQYVGHSECDPYCTP